MGATRDDLIKCPRTPHLFGSKGTDDDKHLDREESEVCVAGPSNFENPKGISAISPGLRGTSYPGSS